MRMMVMMVGMVRLVAVDSNHDTTHSNCRNDYSPTLIVMVTADRLISYDEVGWVYLALIDSLRRIVLLAY